MPFFQYFLNNYPKILKLFLQHIQLTFFAVIMSIIIGIPLGLLISLYKKTSKPILAITNLMGLIPYMATLGFIILLFGIGSKPSIIMVMLYALLPIVRNTSKGLKGISAEMLETARGIGLTSRQILFKIQFPLAMPAIIRGIRIGSVFAVGLMTLCAYIGAGGLGILIFSGIHMNDTNMILSGAVPLCVLTLIINWIFLHIEKLVTPISLKNKEPIPKNLAKRQKLKRQKKFYSRLGITIIAMLYVTSSFLGISATSKTIVLSSKAYSEQVLLGNMTADLIEAHTGIKVERKLGLGGTDACLDALSTGEVDLQIEYTGTMYSGILNQPCENVSCDEIYDISKKMYKEKYNVVVLDSWGFNNTYALAVRRETAKRFNLKTISDLAKIAPKLKLSSNFDFVNREDGLLGLSKVYNMNFRKIIPIEGKPRYTSLKNKQCDVIVIFTTDALASQYDLVILEDDKEFFLPYNPVPLIRTEVLNQYPELEVVLSKLSHNLTEEQMRELNYRIEVKGEKSEKVSKDFLEKNGYIKR